jgi:MATE family multidrug resistance protein
MWTLMVSIGFNVAVRRAIALFSFYLLLSDDLLSSQMLESCAAPFFSVRVANELGAKHPKAVRFSVTVAIITSAAIGLIFTLVTLVARKQLARLFTSDNLLVKETTKLGYLLAATIFLNSIQPVLSGIPTTDRRIHVFVIQRKINSATCVFLSLAISGVAIGAGWQSLVAFVNIACYYLVGLPLAAVFGFKLKLNAPVRKLNSEWSRLAMRSEFSSGRNVLIFLSHVCIVQGIWVGMLVGTILQTLILFVILFRTKWEK